MKPISLFFTPGSSLNKKLLYWACQLGGWSLWGLYLFSLHGASPNNVLDIAFTVVGLLLLSHLYRSIIVRNGWLKMLFNKLLLRILLASFGFGILSLPVSILSLYIFNSNTFYTQLTVNLLAQSVIVATFLFFCWSVVYFLYHYVSTYNRNLKWEALMNEFELNHLKSQLNPHFIFNALNTVKALIDENPEKAKTSINQLSNILRTSLMLDKKKVIPFTEELELVQDYLALETTRFEERLKVDYQIEDGSDRYRVPPMMLQTLVENGIKHGIAKRKDGGAIQIATKITEGKLQVQIRNSGRYHAEQAKKRAGLGYGLRSTKQRLALLYPNQATFSISNESEDVVLTQIIIPEWNESDLTVNNYAEE